MKLQNLLKLCLLFLVLGSTSASVVAPTPSTPASPPSPSDWNDYNDDYPTTPPPPPAPCNLNDKITLLQIKQAFNTSDLLHTWIPNSDCCNGWDSVECDPISGRVNSLSFQGNSPWGRQDLPAIFPSAIGNLSYLTTLVFINNATGPIPSFISNLRHLGYLDLSRNRLSGHIPQFITQFQNLSVLVLSDNQLTGTIPSQLSQLPYLNFISLENNKLTGCIPDGLFSLFKPTYTNGVYLILGSNKLEGPIPRSLASVKFRRLELGDNKFSGDASFLFDSCGWETAAV